MTLRWFSNKYFVLTLLVLTGLFILLNDHKEAQVGYELRNATSELKSVDILWTSQRTREMERKVRTQDIPYSKFAPLIGERWAREMIWKAHPHLRFLTEMLSSDETVNAISESCDFGDPDKMNCSAFHCYVNGRTVKKEIVRENPNDTLTFLPKEEEFLKEFINPCWNGKDELGREALFCVPYVFLIGVTKSGTTDLYKLLQSHALIEPQSRKKEPHFLDRTRRGRSYRMNQPPLSRPMSFTFYANNGDYRKFLMQTYRKVKGATVLFHGITMDASPSYIWDNEFWETFHPGYKEPPVTNADTLALINPNAKIIIALRDPISRMRSAYQFFCVKVVKTVYQCDTPISPEKYHTLVAEAVERFNNCLINNTVRGCTYSTDTHQLATHLYASIYHVYIADFLKVFPPEQLFIFKMEDRIKDPVTTAMKLCDFLEVPRFPQELINNLTRRDVENKMLDSQKLEYVLPETTSLLEDFFKPHLRDLVTLLGDEKWYWNRPH